MDPHELACHYLTQDERDLPAGLDWLSARERDLLSGVAEHGGGRDWLLGRWTAKQAIAARRLPGARRLPLARVEILATPDGAPEVFVGAVAAPYALSIAQRAGRALCALTARGNAVGCDLEVVAPHDAVVAARAFTDEELALVRAAPAAARDGLATALRSAKTSALKLLREGMRLQAMVAEVVLGEASEGETWAPLVVESPEHRCLLPGWWRPQEDVVLTLVSAAASGAPRALDRPAEARVEGEP